MVLALSILLAITSVLMILLVLLHKGKGSGLSDLFGGGISSTYGAPFFPFVTRRPPTVPGRAPLPILPAPRQGDHTPAPSGPMKPGPRQSPT